MNMVLSKKEERLLESLLFNIGRRYGNTNTADDDIKKLPISYLESSMKKRNYFLY